MWPLKFPISFIIFNGRFQIRLDYGGSDITQSFHYLLQRAGFPYKECQPQHPLDGALLTRIKEGYCHLNLVRITRQFCF
jgi:hypothetical protein